MLIIGTPSPILKRLIAAFAPSQPPLFMPHVESWALLAAQARAFQTPCVIVDLDSPEVDLQFLGPLWLQAFGLPYIVGVTRDKTLGYNAFKNGFNDIHDPGAPTDPVASRYRQARFPYNCYLYFESGKKQLHLESNEILFLKADNYTTDLFLTSGQTIPLFNTLKSYEAYLPSSFVRIQKSLVINTQFLYAVESTKRKCWLMGYAGIFTYSPIYIKNPALLVRQPQNRFHCV